MPLLNRSTLLCFLLFTAFPIYIWSKIQPIQIAPKAAYLASLIIFSLAFFTPVIRAAQYQDMAAAPPWQLGLSYDGYLDDESIVSKNFIEDSIVVGDPYGKSLSLLKGTTHIKISQHGAH